MPDLSTAPPPAVTVASPFVRGLFGGLVWGCLIAGLGVAIWRAEVDLSLLRQRRCGLFPLSMWLWLGLVDDEIRVCDALVCGRQGLRWCQIVALPSIPRLRLRRKSKGKRWGRCFVYVVNRRSFDLEGFRGFTGFVGLLEPQID